MSSFERTRSLRPPQGHGSCRAPQQAPWSGAGPWALTPGLRRCSVAWRSFGSHFARLAQGRSVCSGESDSSSDHVDILSCLLGSKISHILRWCPRVMRLRAGAALRTPGTHLLPQWNLRVGLQCGCRHADLPCEGGALSFCFWSL